MTPFMLRNFFFPLPAFAFSACSAFMFSAASAFSFFTLSLRMATIEASISFISAALLFRTAFLMNALTVSL